MGNATLGAALAELLPIQQQSAWSRLPANLRGIASGLAAPRKGPSGAAPIR